jgi:hypothetical protein
MAKRYTRKRRQRRHRRRTMKGGAFTQQELQQLQNSGFNQHQIESLTDLGVSFNEVIQKVDTITNQEDFSGNSDDVAEQVMVELLNEHIFENPSNQSDIIPHADDDPHYLDMDQSFDSQGTMNLNELNISNVSDMSGYTTSPDESDNEFGGRRRRKRKTRRGKKSRKTRKQRGGKCFGNGVGANSNDPNFSIYNTNLLKLFPYRPN